MRIHHSEIDNPYALAWYMKNKGDKPHYNKTKDDKSTGDKVPPKKKEKKHESFKEWLAERELLERKLTASTRNRLDGDEFAEPGQRKYPIEDRSHARNALTRVSQFGSPQEKKKVRAAVHRKYPEIGRDNQ